MGEWLIVDGRDGCDLSHYEIDARELLSHGKLETQYVRPQCHFYFHLLSLFRNNLTLIRVGTFLWL